MITIDQFEAYEMVRSSRITNMYDLGYVSRLSGLGREEILEIMKGYDELMRTYPDVRDKIDKESMRFLHYENEAM